MLYLQIVVRGITDALERYAKRTEESEAAPFEEALGSLKASLSMSEKFDKMEHMGFWVAVNKALQDLKSHLEALKTPDAQGSVRMVGLSLGLLAEACDLIGMAGVQRVADTTSERSPAEIVLTGLLDYYFQLYLKSVAVGHLSSGLEAGGTSAASSSASSAPSAAPGSASSVWWQDWQWLLRGSGDWIPKPHYISQLQHKLREGIELLSGRVASTSPKQQKLECALAEHVVATMECFGAQQGTPEGQGLAEVLGGLKAKLAASEKFKTAQKASESRATMDYQKAVSARTQALSQSQKSKDENTSTKTSSDSPGQVVDSPCSINSNSSGSQFGVVSLPDSPQYTAAPMSSPPFQAEEGQFGVMSLPNSPAFDTLQEGARGLMSPALSDLSLASLPANPPMSPAPDWAAGSTWNSPSSIGRRVTRTASAASAVSSVTSPAAQAVDAVPRAVGRGSVTVSVSSIHPVLSLEPQLSPRGVLGPVVVVPNNLPPLSSTNSNGQRRATSHTGFSSPPASMPSALPFEKHHPSGGGVHHGTSMKRESSNKAAALTAHLPPLSPTAISAVHGGKSDLIYDVDTTPRPSSDSPSAEKAVRPATLSCTPSMPSAVAVDSASSAAIDVPAAAPPLERNPSGSRGAHHSTSKRGPSGRAILTLPLPPSSPTVIATGSEAKSDLIHVADETLRPASDSPTGEKGIRPILPCASSAVAVEGVSSSSESALPSPTVVSEPASSAAQAAVEPAPPANKRPLDMQNFLLYGYDLREVDPKTGQLRPGLPGPHSGQDSKSNSGRLVIPANPHMRGPLGLAFYHKAASAKKK